MPLGGPPVSVTGCIRKKNICGLGVGILMVSEILGFLLNKGAGHSPRESPTGVTGCFLA